MQDDLLWVYEGLTNYLGTVLTARSGLLTHEQARDDLAFTAAGLDHTPGRTWRNLQDTADAAPELYFSPQSLALLASQYRFLRRRHSELALGGRHHPPAKQRQENH